MIRKNAFQSHDAMSMSRPINVPYAAAPDFFQNLIIAYSPLGVLDFEFAEYVRKRFLRPGRDWGTQTLSKQAAQTKTASNTRCRSTLRAGERFLVETN